MVKLDLKDRKILYELDLNCRQSNSQIGKKVGLGRDVVGYRIKKLEDEGIITQYWANINTFKLGYNVFRIYLNFRDVTPKKKQEIINYFVNYKNSWVVASIKSGIDLDVVIWVKSIYEFYHFWDKTLDNYEKYFDKFDISIYIQANVYRKSYLLPNNDDSKNREMFRIACGEDSVKIDEIDYKLLNELSVNARASLVELGEKFDISSQSINYRIKNLVKNEIINAFRIDIDYDKLGLKNYKIDIYLKNHKMKKPISDYLSKMPSLEFMNFAIGWSDLEPEFVVNRLDELMEILDDINTKFSGSIKKQSFFITEKVYKLRCMPEL